MNKRICIVVQSYYDTDPRVRREAEAWISQDAEVDVIALRTPGDRRKEYSLYGVKVFTVPIDKKRGGKFRYIWEYFAFFVATFFMLWQLMLKRKYNYVQVCTLPDFLVFAALIPKWMGARVVLDMHEVMPEFYMSKYGLPASHWMISLLRWQENASIHFSDWVITINDPICELLRSRNKIGDRITVVVNSVDRQAFQSHKAGVLTVEQPKFIFMYHGTLTYIYGLDIALRGFAKAAPEMPNAEFWILGDGTERGTLEGLAKELNVADQVQFKGVFPHHEIPDWVAQCNAGVLATRQDIYLDLSFSNKLAEYVMMGKPVIVSRLKTIHYYFGEQSLAFFEPHNDVELAKRMLQLYKDPGFCKSLVSQALKEYEPLDWDIVAKKYLQLFDAL